MSIFKAFGAMIQATGNGCQHIGKALAQRVGVPYHEDREVERMLGHRLLSVPKEEAIKQGLLPTRQFQLPDGTVVAEKDVPAHWFNEAKQLTDEVWTKDNWPDNCNDVNGAIQKLTHGITGVYYHRPSMNLVLLGPMGEKVGIRATTLIGPQGLMRDAGRFGLLKKAASA